MGWMGTCWSLDDGSVGPGHVNRANLLMTLLPLASVIEDACSNHMWRHTNHRELEFTEYRTATVFCGTYNVNAKVRG